MAAEKSLLMNVSKDEMDTIDEILQSRQTERVSDRKTGNLTSGSLLLTSAPVKINVSAKSSIETVGALCELKVDSKTNPAAIECTESDDGNEIDDSSSNIIPKSLEELISLEHNYAIKLSTSPESCEVENELVIAEQDKQVFSSEKSVCIQEDKPEISNVVQPVRRSKRQIEKLEREQGEKDAATNDDILVNEGSKEKLLKLEEKAPDEKDSKVSKTETKLDSDVQVTQNLNYCSNYKSFAEFKKRHLKVVVEDCKIGKFEDSIPVVPCNVSEDISQNSCKNEKNKENPLTDDKEIHTIKHPEPLSRSKYLRKTKLGKSNDVVSDEKMDTCAPHFRKKKYLNFVSKDNEASPVKSTEPEEKKLHKGENKKTLKEKKKIDELGSKKNSPAIGMKRKKLSSLSSEKCLGPVESNQPSNVPQVSKRKKCVSFSEDLLFSSKPETVSRKQRMSTDCKDSPQKNTASPVVPPIVPVSKIHKKKVLRRESLRMVINDDEPPLFSQPDVLIKVTNDDTSKREEKETDPHLSNQSDVQIKMKMPDVLMTKEDVKDKLEVKEKPSLKDKHQESVKQTKDNQELKPKQEEKERLELKSKEENLEFRAKEEKHELKAQEEKHELKAQEESHELKAQEENHELKTKLEQKDKKETKTKPDEKEEQKIKTKPDENNKQEIKTKPEEKEEQEIKTKPDEKEKQEIKTKPDEKEKQEMKIEEEKEKQEMKIEEEEKQIKIIQEEKQIKIIQEEKRVKNTEHEDGKQEMKTKLEEGKQEMKTKLEKGKQEMKTTHETKFINSFTDKKDVIDQKTNDTSNFQAAGLNDLPQVKSNLKGADDSYKIPSELFTNIEAFLESAGHKTSLEHEAGNYNPNYMSVNHDSISIASEERVIDDRKGSTISITRQDCKDQMKGTANILESDSSKSSVTTTNETKLIPERKSRRLIKKKEFFGDTSDSSDSRKVSRLQNKKSNSDKKKSRGRKATPKNKIVTTIKMGEQDRRNSHSEQDISTDSDSSAEDDPKKLWCVCRKPHNSRFMIQCDKCEDWFHGSCVGVTKQYGRQLEKEKREWICPNCRMKGESSPQKDEKLSKLFSDLEDLDKKGSKVLDKSYKHLEGDGNKVTLFHGTTVLKSTHSENTESLVKPPQLSTAESSVNEKNVVIKENLDSNNEAKSEKISKIKMPKQLSQHKLPATLKQNPVDAKPADDCAKISLTPKQSTAASLKSSIQSKTPTLPKQSTSSHDMPQAKKGNIVKIPSRSPGKPTIMFTTIKKTNSPKEKGTPIKKKQLCVKCQLEARANSCYCSDECIEKHAAECLKTMREAKGSLKGAEFDSQRLVVLDRLKGNVITSEKGPTAGEIVSWLKDNPSYIIACSSNAPSSAKKDVNAQKKECDSSSSTERRDSADEAAKATVRLNVRKTLKNILIDRCKKADDIDIADDDVQKIAVKIEEELNSYFKDNSFKYRAKYRSLMFNIKDPRNQGLFRKILKGNIPPDRLVRMSSEQLASMELARWREQENQHLLDMIKRVQLEQQKSGSGLLLKKTHKGEVEIEDDLTSVIEQDIPKTILKDVPEDPVEPEKEEVKDSTHLHRSHLFDLNCKICTGKIVPPPIDENVPKKVRVAHSISVDLGSPSASDSVEKSVSRIVDGKSPVSNTADDSMDQEPTSTVSIESPEINVKSTIKDASSKTVSSVWKGFIFMQDIAKFVTSAYKVSGQTDQLQVDLPDTIQVCGRIIPDQVWDYLGKIKQSGNKELVIIRFQAANEEEAVTYNSFYSYLSSRKRYGVVSNYSKKIKDFYILPLAATSPVPMVLVPFDGPGLPSPRPHLLLGVIVRHKFKQSSLPVVPKQPPTSKVEIENIDDSYTPPHETRSYTPPLPILPVLEQSKELKLKAESSPVAAVKEASKNSDSSLNQSTYDVLDEKKTFADTKVSEKTPIPAIDKVSIFAAIEKDEDKPYDPEQDISNIPPGSQEGKAIPESKEKPPAVSLDKHKKILDALTKQVEETDRQVNALKQLISLPEDDVVSQSPSAPSLDISSVAQTGMSSFLDLPENLQEILNTVQLKTHDKEKGIHEKGDVDMRIKSLFGKHFNEPRKDKQPSKSNISGNLNHPSKNRIGLEEVYNSQTATPPPNDDDMDRSSIACPSDPRIKLRTSFQDVPFQSVETPAPKVSLSNMSVSELIVHAQKQLTGETVGDIPLSSSDQKPKGNVTVPPTMLLTSWSPDKEPPPPGIEPTESLTSESMPINVTTDSPVPSPYATSTVVQDSNQHVGSPAFLPQSFSSFQPHLPLGFSVHTPPPNIKHFPPPPILPTSFPPPPLPLHVVPPKGNEPSFVKEQWPALQVPGPQSDGNEWQAGASHWGDTSEHQGNEVEGDSRYYSSDRSSDYNNEHSYKRDSSNRRWERPQRFTHGNWVKHSSRGSRFGNQRRGKRGTSFRRNLRN